MGDTDIDNFIAQQKAKLAVERQTLNDDPSSGGHHNRNDNYNEGRERQKWARFEAGNAPPAPAEQHHQTRDARVVTPVDRGLPLTNRGQEEKQKALALERRREYNDLMEKKAGQKGRASNTNALPPRPGLNIGQYEDERKLLDRERHSEYNNYLEQKRTLATSKLSQHERPVEYPEKREAVNPDAGRFNYQEQRKQLAEERRREYNQLLQQKANPRGKAREEEIGNPSIIPFNRAEQERVKAKILEEERQREYNETLAKMQDRPRKREVTPVPNFDPHTQEQERRLQKEREQREYKAMLDQQQDQQKQMMLLQQGVPYEQVSRMRDEPKPNADYSSQLPPRQNVNDRGDREPFRVPFDNAFERPQPQKKESQVQFDLGLNTKHSPAPEAFSRQRDYEDSSYTQHFYPDRKDFDQPPPHNQRPPQFPEKELDQFECLGFGQYEEHKKRLERERRRELQEHLSQRGCQTKMNSTEYQRQWQQHHARRLKGLDLTVERSPRTIYHELERSLEKENYKKEWREVRRKCRRMEKLDSQRKTWNAPTDVKLSPRGTLDTEAIINRVQKQRAREDYEQQWRQYHQNKQATPAGQNMTGGERLDTDRIIQNVIKGNQADDSPRRRRADADSGLKNLNPSNSSNPILGKDEYRKGWEERKNQLNTTVPDPRRFDAAVANESMLNIDKAAAEAKRETEEYRKKWEELNGQTGQAPFPSLDHRPERKHFDQSSLQRSNSFYEAQKIRLRDEQKKDLNEFLKKSPLSSRLGSHSSPFQTSADYRKRLSEIRNQEYNTLLRKKNEVNSSHNRKWRTPETAAEERVLPLGQYETRHKQYEEQRRRDLQEHLHKSRPTPVQYYQDGYQDRIQEIHGIEQEQGVQAFPLGGYALIRKKLNEERRRDYNEMLANQQFTPRGPSQNQNQNVQGGHYLSPRAPSQNQGQGKGSLLIRDDGRREDRIKKMETDRNKEYNEFLAAKQAKNSILKDQTDEFKAGTQAGNESDNVKWQQRKQRNDEYNAFLASKNQRGRFDDKRQGGGGGGQGQSISSLPRLNYSTSAQKRQREEERNREYNEMLQQKAQGGSRNRGGGGPPADVKTGWGTPDYSDILAKQRAKEQNFRRANDIAFEADPVTRQTEMINRALDRDYEATKKAYARERIYNKQGQGLLENPDWLKHWQDPKHPYYQRYHDHWHPNYHRYYDRWHPNYRHYDYWEEVKHISEKSKPVQKQSHPNGPPSVRRSKDQGGEYFASLPIGRNTDSAQQRQKNRYGNELKMQMAEAATARQIERKEGLLVNNNSVAGQPAVTRPGPRGGDPYYNYLKNLPDYDELSPRSNAILGRRQPTSERLRSKGGLNPAITPRGGDAGVLDLGLFHQPRTTSLDPPAGLVYQPSTFITANAVPNLNSSVDEAYSFYASQNPLDPSAKIDAPVGGGGGGGGQRDIPSLNLSGLGADGPGQASRVRFQEPRIPAQGMQFTTDDERKSDKKQSVNEYRAELERQMAENDIKKQRAKQDRERYERKMEEEAKYYDPFGKGGGGAPMRDTHGNVISDLRQIRSDNLAQTSHRGAAPPPPRELPTFNLDVSPRGGAGGISSYRDDLIGPPPTQTTAGGDPSHARGGHGIFGMPKTDVEKTQADKYKLDLMRQIEEKKADEYRKKQLEKIEEEREQKILDEQRAKIQREYDEELRRNNEKKEEARRKNEEMMRAAEDKKKELERQRQEEDARRQEDIRAQKERELQERQREEEAKRGKSPPIPSLRGKDTGKPEAEEDKEDVESKPEQRQVTRSPPIAGARVVATPVDSRQDHTPYNRAQSADVLNQLTRLRAELRKESDRVQTMLHDQEDDVQIYDPRHVQRPPPGPIIPNKTEVDVFDTALNRNPVAVRRTPNERANSRAVDDFNSLKHKLDTDSRKQFRELYPGEPTTSDALEAQQAALLRHQEERLQYLKDRRALEDTSGLRVAAPGRDTHSSSSQLVSNSAFVEVNGIGHFPDDFEDIPRRNDSARYRRRSRVPPSPQIERIPSPDFNSRATFGSQTSLNVDKMARKNEDRLRKLRDLQGDDLSLYDPEDVLDRFMSKQGHNRPPSRNTLLDDTWMRAASTNNRY